MAPRGAAARDSVGPRPRPTATYSLLSPLLPAPGDQVHAKMDKVRAKQAQGKLDRWLRARPIPVVLGPGRGM